MSVLDRVQVIDGPFKYAVVENALDSDLYQELFRHFPRVNIPKGNNRATLRRGKAILEDRETHPAWKKFIEDHTGSDFYHQAQALFGLTYQGSIGRRKQHHSDIQLECQCATTSPVESPCSTKGPHTDNRKTKWAGILYFRDPRDNAGGDLQFFNVPKPKFNQKNGCINADEVLFTVPYGANIFVAWENNSHAVHGVTPRQRTSLPRRYCNFTIDTRV